MMKAPLRTRLAARRRVLTLMTLSTASICPDCAESKRIRVAVSPRTERFPQPVWKFDCKACGAHWVWDENRDPAGEAARAGDVH